VKEEILVDWNRALGREPRLAVWPRRVRFTGPTPSPDRSGARARNQAERNGRTAATAERRPLALLISGRDAWHDADRDAWLEAGHDAGRDAWHGASRDACDTWRVAVRDASPAAQRDARKRGEGRELIHDGLALEVRERGPRYRADGHGRGRVVPETAPHRRAAAPFPTPPQRLLRLDRLALELRLAHDRLIVPLARAAAVFVAARAWSPCGSARLEDHARERFGRTARWLRQLADLGRALERFPQLARSLTGDDDGLPLGAEAARLVARVVFGSGDPGTERTDADAQLARWVKRAREVPLRVLREEIRTALSADPAVGVELDPARADGDGAPATDAHRDGSLAALRHTRGLRPGNDLDDEPRCVVEIRVPAAVRAAFDEVVDLHRALAGRDASLESAVESVLAEVLSGGLGQERASAGGMAGRGSAGFGCGADAECPAPGARGPASPEGRASGDDWIFGSSALGIARRSLGRDAPGLPRDARSRRAARQLRESRLERAASGWAGPPAEPGADAEAGLDAVLRRAEASLAEFRLLAASAGTGGPLDLDRQIARLVELEDALMRRLGEITLELSRRGAFATFSFTGIGHYAESRLGLPATVLEDRVRVARRLVSLPLLRDAYERGQLALDALLVVLRTLGRGTIPADVERAWLLRARQATVKRLRDEARAIGRRALELPPEPCDAVDGPDESAAAECQGVGSSRLGPPLPLPDTAWDASLRREPGLARRRVLQAGLLALHSPSSPDVFLRLRLPEALADDLLAAIEAARRGLSTLADSVPWHQDWPDRPALPSLLAARTFSVRARRVPSWVGLLALLEDAALTWDDPREFPRRPGDAVYRRDGFRCTAPGCTARSAIHEHHVVFRSRGGSDSPANRVALCAAHHAALHERDTLAVTGSAPLDLTWRLGPPGAALHFRCERRL
jgi:hypothetical protein